MMRLNLIALIVTVSLGTMTASFAQSSGSVRLPDTEAGRRVGEYIKAFNTGEEAIRAFIASNVSKEGLERRSLDERLNIYREMRSNMESITPRRIIETSESRITILFETKRGDWFEIGFLFEPQSPHYLQGLRVEDAEPPDASPTKTDGKTSTAPMTQSELVSAVENYLDELARNDKFSGVVLLTDANRKVIFQKSYGFANKTYNAPNRIDTKFNLGSINKTFTKVAIGQLMEQGKLALTDTIGKHLPDYPNRQAAEKVTIEQLLDMTSGIGDFFGEKFAATPKDRIRKINDYFQFFASEPLQFEPGTNRRYSNGGYVVLGAIIEKVSGQSYYDYVREHITRLAGMTSTDYFELDQLPPNTATGYTLRAGSANGERRANIYTLPARGSSAGGGYSTAEDLLKFIAALESNKLLKAETMLQMFPGLAKWKGAGNRSQDGGFGVAGGSPGVNAEIDIEFGNGYAYIVLSNYDPPIAETVGKQIRALLARVKN
ncbi:MAG TPA: serine hydrolase domain-containing protein [Blastocatellia bacterium]|nr:serine hydrolase domain-containing protein [Blastocatellia bacterium]